MHTYNTYEKAPPPKSKVHWSVRHHMPVRIDALGMGSDENKPCVDLALRFKP